MVERSSDVPINLLRLQEEFSLSIRVPFDFSTGSFAFQKERYSSQAVDAIRPRGEQGGRERLAVYNEQYWFRMLTVMQKDFPLLSHALSQWEFNQLTTAYLDRYPSRHPALDHLADRFPAFIRESKWNQPRNIQMADLDFAFLRAVHAPEMEYLDPARMEQSDREALSDSPLHLQPHISLLEEDWNLAECRRLGLNAGDDYRPKFRQNKGYWAVYRAGVVVEHREIDAIQFRLLSLLVSGQSLSMACENTAIALSPEETPRLASELANWFAAWTAARWFIRPIAR